MPSVMSPTLLTLGDTELVLQTLSSWSLYAQALTVLTKLLPSAADPGQIERLKK